MFPAALRTPNDADAADLLHGRFELFGSQDQSHQVRIPSQCLGFVRQREAGQKQTCILDYSAVNWMGNSEGGCGGNNDNTRALTTPISILRTVSMGVI